MKIDILKWIISPEGVVITGCDQNFEGAMAIPRSIDGVPVVEIGEKAFANCGTIVSVVIPDSVDVIRMGAFFDCACICESSVGLSWRCRYKRIYFVQKQGFR